MVPNAKLWGILRLRFVACKEKPRYESSVAFSVLEQISAIKARRLFFGGRGRRSRSYIQLGENYFTQDSSEAGHMCIICERELWGEHRVLEREFFKPCKTCKKFPGTSSEGTCYHCFAFGNTIDKCPECGGQPWSEEFLEAKDEIESPDDALLPF